MWILGVFPLILQALGVLFDEIYFHSIRRELPLRERISRPIDSASILTCIAYILFIPFSINNLFIFCGLVMFVCLLVTRNQFIHKDRFSKAETRMYSFLSLIHPIALLSAGFIWPVIQGIEVTAGIAYCLNDPSILYFCLQAHFWLLSAFLCYQIMLIPLQSHQRKPYRK